MKAKGLAYTAGTLVGVVALAFGVDAAYAAHVERTLASYAREADDLPADPDTYVGGFPFAQVVATGKVPRVSFQALDVQLDGIGIVNTRTDIYDIVVDAERAFAADFAGTQAKRVEHTLSLDGVAFGQLLGMTDLDIANPYDISPTGGSASEAQLTGTVPGTSEKTSAVVALRIHGSTFRMEPKQLIDVPAGLAPAVESAYTLELDTRDLPIGAQADMVEVAGGSIRFSSQEHAVTVTPGLLSPIAKPANG